jgi:hypothetical protein
VSLELKDYEHAAQPSRVRWNQPPVALFAFWQHWAAHDCAGVHEAIVKQGTAPPPQAEKFLDELIGWRELAVLLVRHEPNYDNWECAAPWARKRCSSTRAMRGHIATA